MEELLIDMSLSSLVERCNNEISKYSRKEPFDDQYCLEIFRRAMLQHDEQAWDVLQQRFHDRVLAWIHSHPQRAVAMRLDSEENYVAQTFARLWIATRKQEITFPSQVAFLRFLRASLHTVLIDTLRTQARSEQLSQPFPEIEDQSNLAYDQGSEFWEAIQTFLPGEREKQLAYLMYYCNLKPREIIKYTNSFKDIREINRLQRNIMDRLMRNADQIRWRLSSEP